VYDVRDSPELLTNVDTLIEVSEGVEGWLCHVLQCIDSFACPPLQAFLHPSEVCVPLFLPSPPPRPLRRIVFSWRRISKLPVVWTERIRATSSPPNLSPLALPSPLPASLCDRYRHHHNISSPPHRHTSHRHRAAGDTQRGRRKSYGQSVSQSGPGEGVCVYSVDKETNYGAQTRSEKLSWRRSGGGSLFFLALPLRRPP
jgi:hypothetical protein